MRQLESFFEFEIYHWYWYGLEQQCKQRIWPWREQLTPKLALPKKTESMLRDEVKNWKDWKIINKRNQKIN